MLQLMLLMLLLQPVLTADLRERDAETSENAAISSDSEVKFRVVCVGNVVRGSSIRLSKQRALKRTEKIGKFGSNFGNGKDWFYADCAVKKGLPAASPYTIP